MKQKQFNRKAGAIYVMSYTKNNISIIALLLTIFIFGGAYFIQNQVFTLEPSSYQEPLHTAYSKIIPIQEQKEQIKPVQIASNLADTFIHPNEQKVKKSPLLEEIKQAEKQQEEIKQKYTTQRQVVQANKDNTWRIQIPKIGLNAHIQEGATTDILLSAVGHFKGTATWNGNVCLAGHNRGYLCNFFQKIKNLAIGDEIIYSTAQGKRIYKVQTNQVILETDWSYIEKTTDNRITLITCEANRGEYRRCVQAVQIAEKYHKIDER